MGTMQADPIQSAIEQFNSIETYSVTLRSHSKGSTEEIRYYFKKPGFIRMEFVTPHNGAILIYDPNTKMVRLRPFGLLKSLVLTLSPDNPLIKSSKSHTVDNSDIGELLNNIKELQSKGRRELLKEDKLGGRDSIVVRFSGENDFTVGDINQYIIWFDKDTLLPIKVEAYDKSGSLIEDVLMDDLKINIDLPEDFFKL